MSVLSSRRSRRRLTIAAVFVVVAIPLGYLAVHYSNSASPRDAERAVRERRLLPPAEARSVHRREAPRGQRRPLAKFISGAVSKHDLAGTWDLAGPDLRQGMTRDDWLKGQLPIVPFAASERGQGKWSLVSYSYANKVGLELLMFPERRSGQLATVETDVVRGKDGHWRVNYWMITKLHGPGSRLPRLTRPRRLSEWTAERPQAPGQEERPDSRFTARGCR